MRFEEKRVTLKDGRVLLIRPAMPCDAEELIRYLKQTAAETRFLLRYPDEWNLTAEKERELLQGYLDNPSAAMAVAIVMPGAGENGAEASRPDDGSSADSAAADAVSGGADGVPVLAGNSSIVPVGGARRVRHRCALAIALKKEFWGLGIGTALIRYQQELARRIGYERMELEYVEGNERGKALYEKCGFSETGRIRMANKYDDGSYSDDILMSVTL